MELVNGRKSSSSSSGSSSSSSSNGGGGGGGGGLKAVLALQVSPSHKQRSLHPNGKCSVC